MKLLEAPRLRTSRDRRVTGVELFFDLIFVAAVAEVGLPLSAHYSLNAGFVSGKPEH